MERFELACICIYNDRDLRYTHAYLTGLSGHLWWCKQTNVRLTQQGR